MSVVVYLNGGPCDGTNKSLTQAQYDSQTTTCQGTTYRYDPTESRGFELPVFSSQDSYGKPGAGATGLTAPRAHSGWHALRRSINHNLPDALRVSQKNTQAALRSIARAHKVRI